METKFKDRIKRFFKNLVSVQSNFYSINDLTSSDLFNNVGELSESIFSAISKVSNTFASMPLKLYDGAYNEPTDVPAYNLLVNGPRYFTGFDFRRDIEALRNLKGNVYVQIFRDINGNIVDLALVKPEACQPLFDVKTGELYYAVSAIDNGMVKETMYVHYTQMLHLKFPRFGSVKGVNPMQLLKNTIDYDLQVKKISLDQLVGTNEGFIVHYDTNMDEEQQKEIVKRIAQFYKDNGGVLFEENGVTISRIERDLVDSKLLDVDQVTRSKVAMVYNIPEHFLGNSNGSYNSLEQLNLEFVTGNLAATIRQYEEEFNKKLLTEAQRKKGYHFKFNMNALLRGDTQTRGSFYQIGIRSGFLTPNDVRILEDLPPDNDPNANKLWVSGDLYTIDTPASERKGGGSNAESKTAK